MVFPCDLLARLRPLCFPLSIFIDCNILLRAESESDFVKNVLSRPLLFFFFPQVNFYCGIFLLVCVVLDRYRSVRRAARCFSESRTAWVTCLCVCLCSIGLAVPRGIFTETADVPGRDRTLCVESYSASSTVGQLLTRLLHHVLGFLLPAAILIVCCSCVVLRLRSSSRESQKQRASVVVLFSTAAFLLFWMPHNIALFLDTVRSRYEESENSLKTALMVTSVFGCIHTCVRPLLYLCLSANFRAWALALLKRAPVEHAGSLWGLGVGEDEVREQSPMGEEQERMKDGNHQMQSSHC